MHPQHHHGHAGGDAGEQNIPEHRLGDDYLGDDHLGDDYLGNDCWITYGLHTNFDMSVFIAGHIIISIHTPCNQEVYQEMLFLVADTLHPFMESTTLFRRMPFG